MYNKCNQGDWEQLLKWAVHYAAISEELILRIWWNSSFNLSREIRVFINHKMKFRVWQSTFITDRELTNRKHVEEMGSLHKRGWGNNVQTKLRSLSPNPKYRPEVAISTWSDFAVPAREDDKRFSNFQRWSSRHQRMSTTAEQTVEESSSGCLRLETICYRFSLQTRRQSPMLVFPNPTSSSYR